MQATGSRNYRVVTANGVGIVSHAGTLMVSELADRFGLSAVFGEAMCTTRRRSGGHDPGRVLVDLAEALADGAETIADLRTLVDQALLHGPVASTATVRRVRKSSTPPGWLRCVRRGRWRVSGLPSRPSPAATTPVAG